MGGTAPCQDKLWPHPRPPLSHHYIYSHSIVMTAHTVKFGIELIFMLERLYTSLCNRQYNTYKKDCFLSCAVIA